MKTTFAAVLLLIPILFSGCYKQDLSLCGVNENLVLVLELSDGGTGGTFADKINYVDIVLFDGQKNFHSAQRITKDEFTDRNKVRVTVQPGEYHVVAWGNVGDNSLLNKGSDFAGSYLETTSDICGCPLYYGPRLSAKTRTTSGTRGGEDATYYIDVPQGRQVVKEIKLVRAHRTVRVWIKGLERIHDHSTVQPKIELTNIPYKYDFYLNTDPARKNFIGTATDESEANSSISLRMVSFSAPIGDFADDMQINIRCGTTGEQLVAPISLKDFVDSNDIPDINDFDVMVSATTNAQVDIYLPDWDEEEVTPKKH